MKEMILDLLIARAAQSGLVRGAEEDRGGTLADIAKRSHSLYSPASSPPAAYLQVEAQHNLLHRLLLRLFLIPHFSGSTAWFSEKIGEADLRELWTEITGQIKKVWKRLDQTSIRGSEKPCCRR